MLILLSSYSHQTKSCDDLGSNATMKEIEVVWKCEDSRNIFILFQNKTNDHHEK